MPRLATINFDSVQAYIQDKAAQPTGISAEQVSLAFGCTKWVAVKQIATATITWRLVKAQHWSGRYESETRWFVDPAHAAEFKEKGLKPPARNLAMPRTHIEPIDLPTCLHKPAYAPRAGAMDFAQWPSRRGNALHYRDGRVEHLDTAAKP
jgi:hypothetical protein